MSAISNFLTFLRSAIYAIDVRDGIADAIEQCYKDVNNPTLKTEALEAALQTKIDEGEMAALTIGDGTITAAKLASGVIDNTLATSGAAADAKKTGDEIAAVKADLKDMTVVSSPQMVQGGIASATGSASTSTTRLRSNPSAAHVVSCDNGYKFIIVAYSTSTISSDSYVGMWNGSEFEKTATWFTNPVTLNINDGYYYVIVFAKTGDTTIESTDAEHLHITTLTDSTLSKVGMGADAKATGKRFDGINSDINMVNASISKINESLIPLWADSIALNTSTSSIISSSGVLTTITGSLNENYIVKKYSVTPSENYKITGSAAYKNLIYAFFDANDSLVLKGTASASGGTDTVITDELVTAPSGASYVLVAHHTTTLTTSICKYISDIVPDKSYLRKWVGKKWVCVGDSLTAINDKTTKHYFDYVSENTGITVVNMGVSGTGYARRQANNEAFYQRISDCPTDADVVTIFGSFNDIGAGLEIGTISDTGTTTIAGCINTTIDNLQTVIPAVRLGIVAPTPWDTTQPATTGNAYNYVQIIKDICEHRSIPFLDLWRGSNLRPWDSDFRTLAYSKDEGNGTHPDETGHAIIAPYFRAFLESLIM